jgi:hypothetical protein
MRIQQTTTDAIPAALEFSSADRSRGGDTDHRTTYLWLDAGQSWPFLRGTETISNRALCGWLTAVAACAFWVAILVATGGMRPVEATAQMELLAQKLDRATVIPAPTANQLERLIGQPGYDCRHVSCSAELAVRNEAARTRLKQLLASKGPANGLDASANRSPQTSARDPEKARPGLDPGSRPAFGKGHVQGNKIERAGDSKKSHPVLAAENTY